MTIGTWLIHSLDDAAVPFLALAVAAWSLCRARRMLRTAPLADQLALCAMCMGSVGTAAEFVKWVDVGSWPLALLLLGSGAWNGLPNAREWVRSRFPAERRAMRALHAAIGIREG